MFLACLPAALLSCWSHATAKGTSRAHAHPQVCFCIELVSSGGVGLNNFVISLLTVYSPSAGQSRAVAGAMMLLKEQVTWTLYTLRFV